MKAPKKSSLSQSEISRFHECCPLKLQNFPEKVCQNGLSRARWTADNFGYLPGEERQAPGCPFGMLTEDKHSYCFFKRMADLDQPFTEDEISRFLSLSKDQIRKIISTSFFKLRDHDFIKELEQLHRDGGLFSDQPEDDSDIYFPDHFNADSVQEDGVVEDFSETVSPDPK